MTETWDKVWVCNYPHAHRGCSTHWTEHTQLCIQNHCHLHYGIDTWSMRTKVELQRPERVHYLSYFFFIIINLSPCSRSLNQIIGTGYETNNSSKLTIAKPQSIYRYCIYFPKNYYLCFLNEGKLKLLPNIFSIGISSQNFWQSLIIFSVFKMFY